MSVYVFAWESILNKLYQLPNYQVVCTFTGLPCRCHHRHSSYHRPIQFLVLHSLGETQSEIFAFCYFGVYMHKMSCTIQHLLSPKHRIIIYCVHGISGQNEVCCLPHRKGDGWDIHSHSIHPSIVRVETNQRLHPISSQPTADTPNFNNVGCVRRYHQHLQFKLKNRVAEIATKQASKNMGI